MEMDQEFFRKNTNNPNWTGESTKHTPGPWKLTLANRPDIYEIGVEGLHYDNSGDTLTICDITNDGFDAETNKANAELIARAPELLQENNRWHELFEEYKQTLNKYQNRIEELEAERNDLLAKVSEQEKEIEEYRIKLTCWEESYMAQENKQLQVQVSEQSQKIQELLQEVAALKSNVEAQVDIEIQLREENERLKKMMIETLTESEINRIERQAEMIEQQAKRIEELETNYKAITFLQQQDRINKLEELLKRAKVMLPAYISSGANPQIDYDSQALYYEIEQALTK